MLRRVHNLGQKRLGNTCTQSITLGVRHAVNQFLSFCRKHLGRQVVCSAQTKRVQDFHVAGILGSCCCVFWHVLIDHADVSLAKIFEGVGFSFPHAFAFVAFVNQGIDAALDVVKSPDVRDLANANHVAVFVQVVDVIQLEAARIFTAKFCGSCFLAGDGLGFLESFLEGIILQDLQQAGIINRAMGVGCVVEIICIGTQGSHQLVFLGRVVDTLADVFKSTRSSRFTATFQAFIQALAKDLAARAWASNYGFAKS